MVILEKRTNNSKNLGIYVYTYRSLREPGLEASIYLPFREL